MMFRALTRFRKSVGVVKIKCTLYATQLEYQTVVFKIDYTYTEKYLYPNLMSWPWLFDLTPAPLGNSLSWLKWLGGNTRHANKL